MFWHAAFFEKNPTWSDVHDGKLVVVGVDVAAVVVVDDVADFLAASRTNILRKESKGWGSREAMRASSLL